jgi:hypothetical protein
MVLTLMVVSHGIAGATDGEAGGSEAFIRALGAAIDAGDIRMLEKLTCFDGAGEDDRRRMSNSLRMTLINGRKAGGISLMPLPDDFEPVLIVQGRKIEPTAPPRGMVRVVFKDAGQGGAESSMPYAVVGGAHLLVGLKSTDLQWRGPPDRNISYSIRGSGADGLHIHGIWTASGVRMEKTFKTANLTFWGRQFEEFTVTSDNGACDVTLVIKEGDEMVFSGPLKGKGVLQYRGKQARPTEDDGGRP